MERAGAKVKLPKAIDDVFARVTDVGIAESIVTWKRDQMTEIEQEVFKQRKRLADAKRKLAIKDQRIATGNVEAPCGA